MSLVRAERRRFLKRRLTIWMMVIGVLILGAVTAGLALTHEKPTAATLAAAEADGRGGSTRSRCKQYERFKTECEAMAGAKEAGKCEGPQRDWFKAEYYMPSQFEFKPMFGELLIVWAAIIAMVGVRARGHVRRRRVEFGRDDEPAHLAAQADERAGHQARRRWRAGWPPSVW